MTIIPLYHTFFDYHDTTFSVDYFFDYPSIHEIKLFERKKYCFEKPQISFVSQPWTSMNHHKLRPRAQICAGSPPWQDHFRTPLRRFCLPRRVLILSSQARTKPWFYFVFLVVNSVAIHHGISCRHSSSPRHAQLHRGGRGHRRNQARRRRSEWARSKATMANFNLLHTWSLKSWYIYMLPRTSIIVKWPLDFDPNCWSWIWTKRVSRICTTGPCGFILYRLGPLCF